MNRDTMVALRTLLQAYPLPGSAFEVVPFFAAGDYRPALAPLFDQGLLVPLKNDHSAARYKLAAGAAAALEAWESEYGPAICTEALAGKDAKVIRYLLNDHLFMTGDVICMADLEYDHRLDGFNQYVHSKFIARMTARGLLVPLGEQCYEVTGHLAAQCKSLDPADWETLCKEERENARLEIERRFKRAADLR